MINIIYIYPNIDFINNEINICRIIDENIKETIVIYGVKKGTKIEIYLTNTLTGIDKLLNEVKNIEDIVSFIKSNENEIRILENLEYVEKYILNKKN